MRAICLDTAKRDANNCNTSLSKQSICSRSIRNSSSATTLSVLRITNPPINAASSSGLSCCPASVNATEGCG